MNADDNPAKCSKDKPLVQPTLNSLEKDWYDERYLQRLGANKLLYQSHPLDGKSKAFESAEDKQLFANFISKAVAKVVEKHQSQLVTLFGVSGSGKSLLRREIIDCITTLREANTAVSKRSTDLLTGILQLPSVSKGHGVAKFDDNITLSPQKLESLSQSPQKLENATISPQKQENITLSPEKLDRLTLSPEKLDRVAPSDLGTSGERALKTITETHKLQGQDGNAPDAAADLEFFRYAKFRETLTNAYTVLEAFGNSSTRLERDTTRFFSYSITEFDHLRRPVSHRIQTSLLKRDFLPSSDHSEYATFDIFHQFMAALLSVSEDEVAKQKQRSLQNLSSSPPETLPGLQGIQSNNTAASASSQSKSVLNNASSSFALSPFINSVQHPRPPQLSKSDILFDRAQHSLSGSSHALNEMNSSAKDKNLRSGLFGRNVNSNSMHPSQSMQNLPVDGQVKKGKDSSTGGPSWPHCTFVEFPVVMTLDRYKWTPKELKSSRWMTSRIANYGEQEAFHFKKTLEALKALQFTEAEILALLDVLSAIMHLGDMDFSTLNNKTSDDASALVLAAINKVAGLLQIPLEMLYDSLLKQTLSTPHGAQKVQVSGEVASSRRNLLAISMYSQLFSWITRRLSCSCCVENAASANCPELSNLQQTTSGSPTALVTRDTSLGKLETNGRKYSTLVVCELIGSNLGREDCDLECLLINYATEWFQYELDKKVNIKRHSFWMQEQNEITDTEEQSQNNFLDLAIRSPIFGMRVMIGWISNACKDLSYSGSLESFVNAAAADLAQQMGVEGRLDEKPPDFLLADTPYASLNLTEECVPILKTVAASVRQNKFSVTHFGGSYSAKYAIAPIDVVRQRILIDPSVTSLLKTSSKAVIQSIVSYNQQLERCDSSAPSMSGVVYNTSLMEMERFGLSLANFVAQSTVSSINCVLPFKKTPASKAPIVYDREFVAKQLELVNLDETLKLINNGFESSESYESLARRYRLLLPKNLKSASSDRSAVEWLVKDIGAEDQVKFGATSLLCKSESVLDTLERKREQHLPHVVSFLQSFYRFKQHKKILRQKLMAKRIYRAYVRYKAYQYIQTILTTYHIHPYSRTGPEKSVDYIMKHITRNSETLPAPVSILKPSSKVLKASAPKFLTNPNLDITSVKLAPSEMEPVLSSFVAVTPPNVKSRSSDEGYSFASASSLSSNSSLSQSAKVPQLKDLPSSPPTVEGTVNDTRLSERVPESALSQELSSAYLSVPPSGELTPGVSMTESSSSNAESLPHLMIQSPSNNRLEAKGSSLHVMPPSVLNFGAKFVLSEPKTVIIKDPKQAKWPLAPLKKLAALSVLARKIYCLWRISSMPENMQIIMRRRLESRMVFRNIKEWDMGCIFKGNYLFDIQSPQQRPKLFQFLVALGKSPDPEVFLPIAVEFSKVRVSGEQVQRGFFVTDKRVWVLDTVKWKPTRASIPIGCITGLSMSRGKDSILILHVNNRKCGSDIVMNLESHSLLVELVILLTEVVGALTKANLRVTFYEHTLYYVTRRGSVCALSVDSHIATTNDRLIFVKLPGKNLLKALSISQMFTSSVKKAHGDTDANHTANNTARVENTLNSSAVANSVSRKLIC